MKSLKELTEAKSNWPLIEKMMQSAVNNFEVLPRDQKRAEDAIVALQQSVESLMGAVTYNTGGIMFDHGWLRLLGSGSKRLERDITTWNKGRSFDEGEVPGFLMVADDAIGGIFAVNGNELGEDAGMMYYLAPDSVEWEPLDVNYHQFLEFCFAGQIADFYDYFRWEGWENDIKHMSGDEAIMFNPPLWEELPEELENREHNVMSMADAYEVLLEANNVLLEFAEEDMGDAECDEDDIEDDDGHHHGCCCGDHDEDDNGGCCGHDHKKK